jgi:hypothetical protein
LWLTFHHHQASPASLFFVEKTKPWTDIRPLAIKWIPVCLVARTRLSPGPLRMPVLVPMAIQTTSGMKEMNEMMHPASIHAGAAASQAGTQQDGTPHWMSLKTRLGYF